MNVRAADPVVHLAELAPQRYFGPAERAIWARLGRQADAAAAATGRSFRESDVTAWEVFVRSALVVRIALANGEPGAAQLAQEANRLGLVFGLGPRLGVLGAR